MLSAINQKDNNINEFMAYVLTSMRERKKYTQSALRIIVHLDSYKHWFSNDDDSSSRPDFLMLTVLPSDDELKLEQNVIYCYYNSEKNTFTFASDQESLKSILAGVFSYTDTLWSEMDTDELEMWHERYKDEGQEIPCLSFEYEDK